MNKRPDAFTLLENGWILKVHPPAVTGSNRVLLMLHGWTGDETVMSVFGQKVSPDYWLLSPRGPVKTPTSGFGWLPVVSGRRGEFTDYLTVIEELDRQVIHWLDFLKISTSTIDVMGFSQGGAVALTYLLKYPDRMDRTACLSGFLPQSRDINVKPDSLTGKQVLIAHGSLDETIPIQMANQSAQFLQKAGAEVTFCQDAVGHKLGPTCYKRLEAFFAT
jgi:phospholipase/carboxylesterase